VTSVKKILSSLFFLQPMFRCLPKQWRTGLCIAFLVSVVRDEPYYVKFHAVKFRVQAYDY